MDYDINTSELLNLLSTMESVKSSVETIVGDTTLSSYSSCESSRITSAINQITSSLERLSNGSEQIYNWLDSYISEFESLENNLANFQGSKADMAPLVFQGSFDNMFAKVTVPTLKSDVSGENLFIDVSTPSYEDGHLFWQAQGNKVNCGATAFTAAVNTLLGEAIYDNVAVWEQMGSYSEAIGCEDSSQAQNWINSQGLQDEIEVIGTHFINTPEDLFEVLEDGGIAVVSAGGQVFKHNDGSYASYPGHYVEFYATDGNGNCYVNDSANHNEANQAGVLYTYDDLQRFFANSHNSVAIKAKK